MISVVWATPISILLLVNCGPAKPQELYSRAPLWEQPDFLQGRCEDCPMASQDGLQRLQHLSMLASATSSSLPSVSSPEPVENGGFRSCCNFSGWQVKTFGISSDTQRGSKAPQRAARGFRFQWKPKSSGGMKLVK